MEDANIVINGAGICWNLCKLLLTVWRRNVVLVDQKGALCPERRLDESSTKDMADHKQREKQTGTLTEIIKR